MIKLKTPYVIQPAENGVVIFRLSDIQNSALDFLRIKVYKNAWEASTAIKELLDKGDEETVEHPPKNLDDDS